MGRHAQELAPTLALAPADVRIVQWLALGWSQRRIAAELNAANVPTPSGRGRWHQVMVGEACKRLGAHKLSTPETAPNPLRGVPFGAFMRRISPKLDAPKHLEPFPSLLAKAHLEPLRVVVSVPVRHGKSTAAMHAIPWWLVQDPKLEIVYATYGGRFAQRSGHQVKQLCARAGVRFIRGRNTLEDSRTEEGGGLLVTSIGGPLTGMGADLMVIDDPVKDRAEAESQDHRDRIEEWFRSTAMTRLSPKASVIVIMSRWHPDDLSGRLLERGWDHVHKRAIETDANGVEHALWPEARPLEWLKTQRRELGDLAFAALFQGDPRAPEGEVFKAPARYTSLPERGYRVVLGIDVAYTGNSRSDYWSCVRLLECAGVYYVAEVSRIKADMHFAEGWLRSMTQHAQGAQLATYASGKDHHIVKHFVNAGLGIITLPANAPKYVRAQRCAAAWNDGRILVPASAPWLDGFLREAINFTGLEGRHDDQVDALVGAFDFITASVGAQAPRFLGSRRW